MELFQKAKLQLVYGWKEKETGNRRFREVVDLRGRKCGKSSETAAVELYSLTSDGETGAEVFACANKLEQSKLIFNEAVNMRAQSPALRAVTKEAARGYLLPGYLFDAKGVGGRHEDNGRTERALLQPG